MNPAPPRIKALAISGAGLCRHGPDVKILFRLLVVAQLPDIDPIVVHQVFADRVMLGDHGLDQIVDAEIGRTRNQVQNLRPHHVNARQYLLQIIRLLLDFGDEVALRDHPPEAKWNGDFLGHNRQPGLLGQGEIAELAEIYVGQDVSVHHEERLAQMVGYESQWAAGAERFLFLADDHANAVFFAAADDAGEIIRHVIRRDDDLLYAVFSERENLDLEHGALADRQQWLGNDVGQRAKTHAQPTCEDDRHPDRHQTLRLAQNDGAAPPAQRC